MNKIIQNKRIITFVLLLLGLPVIFIAANSVQNYLSQATLENATLTLPTTMTTQVGQEFDLPLFLNTDGAAVRGVDISILFDHTRLTLMTVVPTAQSTTPFKTFTPLTSGNTFASAEVVTSD